MPDPLRSLGPDASGWRRHLNDLADRLGVAPGRVAVWLAFAGVASVVVLALVVMGNQRGPAAPLELPRAGSVSAGSGSRSGGESSERSAAPGAPGADAAVSGPVVVDVAGAAVRPGVYRLPPGSRVADAVEAAGGPTKEAVLDQLNLAQPLTDGQQVRIPRPGDPAPLPSPTSGGPGGGGIGAPPAVVNLNTATGEQLDTLRGVGPATASAIIEWRTNNGPFKTVDDLEQVPGIGPAKLEQLRPLVRV